MKVLLVGSDKHYAIETIYFKYLLKHKVNCSFFPIQRLFYDYYYKSFLTKVLVRTGISSILKHLNDEFINRVKEYQPDIIWIFKGMEIMPSTLYLLKRRGIILINYNPDNPFIFSGKGSGNKFITDSINLYDIHFAYDKTIAKELKEKFNSKTFILPFGFDIEESVYQRSLLLNENNKVCFLGNPDILRADFINKLAANGIGIDVYGHNWKQYIKNDKVNINKAVYGEDIWYVLHSYRVQLNLMRVHNLASHNMRSFEVPGIGGIQLAPKTNDHSDFFTNNEEIFLYEDFEDCLSLINSITSMSNLEALQIRKNARKRSLNSGYSYENRTLHFLDCLSIKYE